MALLLCLECPPPRQPVPGVAFSLLVGLASTIRMCFSLTTVVFVVAVMPQLSHL